MPDRTVLREEAQVLGVGLLAEELLPAPLLPIGEADAAGVELHPLALPAVIADLGEDLDGLVHVRLGVFHEKVFHSVHPFVKVEK